MNVRQLPQHGELQFEIEKRRDGIRIYARYGSDIVGGLDAEFCGNFLAVSVMYVVPPWRASGIDEALQARFLHYLETSSE